MFKISRFQDFKISRFFKMIGGVSSEVGLVLKILFFSFLGPDHFHAVTITF